MSQFNNRAQFISAQASEKITLAHVSAKKRLYVFTGPVSNVYSKVVPYFVDGLKQDTQDLTKVNNLVSMPEGSFYYDIETSTLHTRLVGDVDPRDVEVIATYKFFYSDKAVQLSHDLQDISEDVNYEGRIVSSPGYKHKIGINQALTSLIGEGTLHLKNQDAGLDEIFDKLVFENQEVTIYSWNPDLNPSESRVIYRGSITNKSFDDADVKLKIKDQIFALLDAPELNAYTTADNVSESVQGRFKRRVYGRVDGLQCQSIDQIAEGIIATGTVSANANSDQLNGTGTTFLSEIQQDDKIVVGNQEFTVNSVQSDVLITLSDETEYGFSGQPAIITPDNGSTLKNRTYLATGHVCAEVTHNITNVLQFNRVQLDNTSGLFGGDFLEFTDTGERIEIRDVAPNNIIVLQQNMVTKPAVLTTAVRRPIQEVYIGSTRVKADDYVINNASSGCGITFNEDAEFNLTRSKNTVFSATFTNGSRTVSVANNEVALTEVFTPGDWIKPDNVVYDTFYRIVNVNDTSLDIDIVFADPTISDTIEIKAVQYLKDDSVVSVNILGKTEDNTASGQWIFNAAQVNRDLIKDINITVINDASFDSAELDGPQLISMAIPENFQSKSIPTVKDITDKINKSVQGSLTLDNDLLIKYQILNVYTGENLPIIKDSDVISWKVKSTNGKTYKTALGKYRFTDVDLSTQENGNKFFSFDSEFVERYIGTNKVDEIELYLYKERDAEIATHRHIYYNQLGVATLSITTDLRLEDIEIGQVVVADFQRLYKRRGSSENRKKVMLVIGKTLTGERAQLELSDLGNTFNTSSFITPNDAPDYLVASEDEKLIYGFITDNQGIVDDDEDTAGVHLIS